MSEIVSPICTYLMSVAHSRRLTALSRCSSTPSYRPDRDLTHAGKFAISCMNPSVRLSDVTEAGRDAAGVPQLMPGLAGQALKRVRVQEVRVELATALRQTMLLTVPDHLPGLYTAAAMGQVRLHAGHRLARTGSLNHRWGRYAARCSWRIRSEPIATISSLVRVSMVGGRGHGRSSAVVSTGRRRPAPRAAGSSGRRGPGDGSTPASREPEEKDLEVHSGSLLPSETVIWPIWRNRRATKMAPG